MNGIRSSLVAAALALGACASGSSSDDCVTSVDCDPGLACVDGRCVPRRISDAGRVDAGPPSGDAGSPDAGSDAGPPRLCSGAAECDDSSLCTTDECVGGMCVLTPVGCDDGDACTDDECDPATGCTTAPTDCDDRDACTVDSCDAASGCAHEPIPALGGTCGTAIDISAGGAFSGDSSCAANDFTGICGGAGGPDVAFVLDLSAESMVSLNASGSSFSPVLFVGSSCGDSSRGCDSSGGASLNVTLPAGRHHVGLDGQVSGDAGAWSLSVSSTPVIREEVITFPSSGDTRSIAIGDRPWNSGDYIQGTRTISLSAIRTAQLTLSISPNGLSCDNQYMRLRINGTAVGDVIIPPGASTVTPSFTFAPISGPTYTFRLETIRTVNGGCGSAGLPDGVSTIRLTN